METHRRQKPTSAGDIFTFPSISDKPQFESELADQLFSNGKLLLHAFPDQPTNFTIPRSVILSRTSSISSKGSLMSSRSSSTNSSSTNSSSTSSSCSSARTSISDASSRRKLSTVKSTKEWPNRNYCNSYGHSQRWQFISPVPVLNRRNSNKRKGSKKKREKVVRKGICRRFFGWLVSTCQECHAIEPSKRLKVSV